MGARARVAVLPAFQSPSGRDAVVFAGGQAPVSCRVSVVLPTHNRAGSLGRAIQSVLSQTFHELELIVVDDASTDGTEELVRRFDDRRLSYVRHPANRGPAAARNTGIRISRGEYIAFQDSDDEWLLDKLEKQVRVMDGCGDEIGVVYCGFVRCEPGWISRIPPARVRVRHGDLSNQLLFGNFVGTPTVLARRHYLLKAGLFDESLRAFEDWHLALRLARICKFEYVDEALVIAHATRISVTTDRPNGNLALDRIAEEHGKLLAPPQFADLLCTLGQLQCSLGNVLQGRRLLARSARLNPLRLQLWIAWLLSLLGAGPYASAHRLAVRLTECLLAGRERGRGAA